MLTAALAPARTRTHARPSEAQPSPEQRTAALIGYLRSIVLAPPAVHERGHVIFLDRASTWLGDCPFGIGSMSALSVRIRALLGEALRLDAAGMILAHSHPSGRCSPSGCDIAATRRLAEVARALDIMLVDHLILTQDAVYSMRAGGLL